MDSGGSTPPNFKSILQGRMDLKFLIQHNLINPDNLLVIKDAIKTSLNILN
jgi:hypothetical protein